MAALSNRLETVADRVRLFYRYKLRSIFLLLRQGAVGYLLGILLEKGIGRNPYLWIRHRLGSGLVTREINGQTMTLDLADSGLSRNLLIRGTHEERASRAYLSALEAAAAGVAQPTVIDIGANLGYYATKSAAVVGESGQVLAVEPDPDNRRLLQLNRAENDLEERMAIAPVAVGDRSGTATLWKSAASNWHRVPTDPAREPASDIVDQIEVEVRDFDTLLAEYDVDPTDVVAVRMDLEGYETRVIEGMGSILSEDAPLVLFIEFHPGNVDDDRLNRAIDSLETADLKLEYAGQDGRDLPISTLSALREVEGSHVRTVLRR